MGAKPTPLYALRAIRSLGLAAFVAACGTTTPPADPDTATSDAADTEVGGFDTLADTLGDIGSDSAPDSAPDAAEDTSPIQDATPDADSGPEEGEFGWPCESATECESGFCIQTVAGEGRVCTEICFEECEHSGFDCLPVENVEGGTSVFLCLPEAAVTCTPCELDIDCGSLAATCVELTDGDWCALGCGPERTCDEGLICSTEVTENGEVDVCIPETRTCTGCWDPDEDGRGIGVDCPFAGEDCAPDDITVYAGAAELCDSVDNDCDDGVDEDYNFETDPDHCGGCGLSCDADFATTACVGGTCGIFACDEGHIDCNGRADDGCEAGIERLNACEGCDLLSGVPGDACGTCGTGTYACEGDNTTRCQGDEGEDATNLCGGCAPLADSPGDPCGTCDSGTWVCEGEEALRCAGDSGSGVLNDCGGCSVLPVEIGADCGTCESGGWACNGPDSVLCVGDEGDRTRNECGGCAELEASVGSPCGPCVDGFWLCNGINALACLAASPDPDGDFVCGDDDVCPGGDDRADRDFDDIPDACDICPDDPENDADGDGVCGLDDLCPGGDDLVDEDFDLVPDFCDRCDGGDDLVDEDFDLVPDFCDCDATECSADASCADDDEGAICTCLAGYSGDGVDCSDIDECGAPGSPCGPNSLCTNTPGSFECSCLSGFSDVGGDCTDIDECSDGSAGCHALATCANTPGAFTCTCNEGYEGDGFTCTNIDECAGAPCDANATCSDSDGSFSCTCNEGYTGDGFTCAPDTFQFATTQVIDGRTVLCSSVVNNSDYTQCTTLTVDGQYFPNGISCSPIWSFSNSSYTDSHGFCASLTGSSNAESFFTCDSTRPRVTWSAGAWGNFDDNGYTQSLRCHY